MASYELDIENSSRTCDRSDCNFPRNQEQMTRAMKALKTLIAASIILAGSSLPGTAAENKWAGYLIDRSCADNCKSQGLGTEYLLTHKKECALNAGCSKDGYSIYSKGTWHPLDKKGSDLARNLLQSSSTSEGHFVVVTGTEDKGQLKVTSLKELALDK